MADMNKALAPWVTTDQDGMWISPDAPANLTELYSKMTSVGYWNGWVA